MKRIYILKRYGEPALACVKLETAATLAAAFDLTERNIDVVPLADMMPLMYWEDFEEYDKGDANGSD